MHRGSRVRSRDENGSEVPARSGRPSPGAPWHHGGVDEQTPPQDDVAGLRGRIRGWRNVHDWVLLTVVVGFALSFASTSWPPLLVALPVAAGILLLDKRKREQAAADRA